MSRKSIIKVRKLTDMTFSDMYRYFLLLKKKTDHIIPHVGANDVNFKETEIVDKMSQSQTFIVEKRNQQIVVQAKLCKLQTN